MTYRYKSLLRVILLAGIALLPMMALDAARRGERMPIGVWIATGAFSAAAAWLSWLMRGRIVVAENGVGFEAAGQRTFIEWGRIERVEYRRLFGAVHVHGAGGAVIRFNDQLQGYTIVCAALASRVPQLAQQQQGNLLPFTIRASAMSWMVMMFLAGMGVFLMGSGFGSMKPDPESDWWARPAIFLFGLASAGFGIGRFVKSIEFGPSAITVSYLVRPVRNFEAGQLTDMRRLTQQYKGADMRGLVLEFDGGASITIGPQQFDLPLEQLAQTLTRAYSL